MKTNIFFFALIFFCTNSYTLAQNSTIGFQLGKLHMPENEYKNQKSGSSIRMIYNNKLHNNIDLHINSGYSTVFYDSSLASLHENYGGYVEMIDCQNSIIYNKKIVNNFNVYSGIGFAFGLFHENNIIRTWKSPNNITFEYHSWVTPILFFPISIGLEYSLFKKIEFILEYNYRFVPDGGFSYSHGQISSFGINYNFQ